jgi:signal transduction histidine kinase
LAHMIGYIDLLSERALGPMTADQVQAVEVLTKSYNRLYSLIDELIQFSMLSQGEMTIYQQSVFTETLVETAISHPAQFASEMDVNLSIQNNAESVKVFADLEKISWVLGELIENAIKFNQSGGRVVLKLEKNDGMVLFQVIDNGIGIREENIEEIFEAFHQVDGSSTRQVGGTGIGLALAKQIVDAHGSKLSVESVLEKGSKFQFYLPKV